MRGRNRPSRRGGPQQRLAHQRVAHAQPARDELDEIVLEDRGGQGRDDRHDLVEQPVAALHGAGLARVEDTLDLEALDRHRAVEQRLHRRRAVLLHDVGRIAAGRQPHDAELDPAALARRVGRAQRLDRARDRLLAGAVGVLQNSASGAMRASAPTCEGVSAVPIEPTTSVTPAWRRATASV